MPFERPNFGTGPPRNDRGNDRPVGNRPNGGNYDRFGTSRPTPPAPHSLRLRDGERELEVSGSADFIRQTLTELPALLARLRGEPAPRASVAMPAAPETAAVIPPHAAPPHETATEPDLEKQILGVLRRGTTPMTVLEIRQRLGADVSGQLVRRTLERSTMVRASDDRPATYRLR